MLAAELNVLEQSAQLKAYKAGRDIFQEGDPGDGLYTIAEGKVSITSLLEHDYRCVLARLGPGDFFGEMAVVDEQPRSATATAEENTEVYFIPREVFLMALKNRPTLIVSLLREFSKRMRDFNHQYVEQALQVERLALVGRLANTLVRQFKNPLAIIRGASDAAGSETVAPRTREWAKDGVCKQVDRMNNLINEFLEFTRGSASTTVLARANYAELVKPLIEEIRNELVNRSVILELENQPPEVNVLVDPARLIHLFQNLFYNACDAMPEGGRIKLRFGRAESDVVTEIEDTGQGVPPEMAARLFEPLAACGKSQSAGLELAICRKIIEDHHGRIQVRSEHGGGTTFIFNLPVARTSPAPPAA